MKSRRGGYKYKSKIVRDGTLEKVKKLIVEEGKTYTEVAKLCGLKSRQQVYEIYGRAKSQNY